MSDLKITGLHKRYGHVPAVRGIDLEVPSGEFTVLVGPSGCGKSTLLRTIAGLEEAQEGTIEIGGRMLLVLQSQATLTHEEHAHQTLAPGIWEIGQVREKDWFTEMVRPVVD